MTTYTLSIDATRRIKNDDPIFLLHRNRPAKNAPTIEPNPCLETERICCAWGLSESVLEGIEF